MEREIVQGSLAASAAALAETAPAVANAVADAAVLVVAALAEGGKVLACGNGGSAADAQHLAAELVGRFEVERGALPALALTTDTSILTAVANDYAYDEVFARQVAALGGAGDVLVALSTSGRSPNVVAAAQAARDRGLRVVALTGRDAGRLGELSDVAVEVPADSTARVQECHLAALHAICAAVDRSRADG